jgi:hypothetical protein
MVAELWFQRIDQHVLGRHLDTMQFTTLIGARMPRSDRPEHGVKTMQVPWAAPQGRFTLLFERFAVGVLLASASVSQACELLGISWDTAQEIMCRAEEPGGQSWRRANQASCVSWLGRCGQDQLIEQQIQPATEFETCLSDRAAISRNPNHV